MEMRSYQAARTFFSILGFLSWGIILLGVIVMLLGMAAVGETSRGFGGPAVAGLAMFPFGLGIMFLGFLGLVFVQSGRANVDTAELTQQGLKIAREQLEISKQALKQGAALEQGYAALQAAKADLQTSTSVPNATYSASYSEAKAKQADHSVGASSITYKDRTIDRVEGGYQFEGAVFDTLENAQAHVDHLGKVAPSKPKQSMPYADQLGVNKTAKSNGPPRS